MRILFGKNLGKKIPHPYSQIENEDGV